MVGSSRLTTPTKATCLTPFASLRIVQELALAKNVILMCGDKTVDFSKINRLTGLSEEDTEIFLDEAFHHDLVYSEDLYPRWSLCDMTRWSFICQMFWENQADRAVPLSKSLLDLIYAFGHMDCHDGHDRIYALLGLLDQSSKALLGHYLDVYYRRSIPELLASTLDFCQRNNEETNISALLDLIIFMKLQHHCSEADGLKTIVAYERFAGAIDVEAEQTQNKLLDPQGYPPDDFDVDELDDWIWDPALVSYDTSMGDKAILSSTNLQSGDRLYRLSPDLASMNVELRPANYDDLVIVVRVHETHAHLVAVGIVPWVRSYSQYVFKDV
jgi:hypothetical protein